MHSKFLVPVLGVVLLAAAPLSGQSLFSTAGLGTPVPPLDARGGSLGVNGVGLIGIDGSLVNPAAIGDFVARGVTATVQPTSRQVEFRGTEGDFRDTRFPLLHAVSPLGERTTISLGYGAYLDQSWEVAGDRAIELSGESVAAQDAAVSDGGIAQFRVQLSRVLRPGLVLGVAGGLLTGRVDRTLERVFPDSVQNGLRGVRVERAWAYSAPLAAVGVEWRMDPAVQVGASVTWAGTLDAEDRDSTLDRSYSLPLQLDAGASAYLSPDLLAALSGHWAGWGSVEPESGPGGELFGAGADIWRLGAGLEFLGIGPGGGFPIRLGGKVGTLPFAPSAGTTGVPAAGDQPFEWSASVGLGLNLAVTDGRPGAVVDATVERGSVSAEGMPGGLSESFWRISTSIALFGR